ncbi:MAG: GH3 auxin-responsive promoter family protein, partial [Cytophagales bacterium]|nr:GH3 auxin-responsive promoter family protein [Cytophagales bacterium]
MALPILGALLKNGIKLRKSIEQRNKTPFYLQKKELKKLLKKSRFTQISAKYDFEAVLDKFHILRRPGPKDFYTTFKKNIPVYNYNKIHAEWWHKSLNGESDVTWPGKIKYFALSSGTSEAASKYIPVSKDMIKAMRITGIRHILTLSNYNLPPELFEKGMLMLGGSTHLNYNGTYFSGDLSGITTGQIPFWFQHFYKPGRKISKHRNWDDKLNEITLKAKDWDIGFVLGVPAWVQILMEKIIDHYKVNNIHEIWPNLTIYGHGGVSFEPYKKSFEKLLGKPLIYIETYLASEGFLAFQAKQGRNLKLMLNNGIFYEFVPFDDQNFDQEGEIIENPKTLMIDEVEEGKEYALLISTCAGAWRYAIGDVIKFTDKKECEIIIVGRTKHYLSLCGEHLSVDNMNKAIKAVSDDLNI